MYVMADSIVFFCAHASEDDSVGSIKLLLGSTLHKHLDIVDCSLKVSCCFVTCNHLVKVARMESPKRSRYENGQDSIRGNG